MAWKPIYRLEIDAIVEYHLADFSSAQTQLFAQVRIPPLKWKLSPWGDMWGGFWAVAMHGDRVLWYNDIADGFNVSRYEVSGQIPESEYWCNQEPLSQALRRLVGDLGARRRWRRGRMSRG